VAGAAAIWRFCAAVLRLSFSPGTNMKTFDLVALGVAAKLNTHGHTLAELGSRTLSVSRFSKHPRWEIHPHDDEYLQVIDGEIEITLLVDGDEQRCVLRPGLACIVPKNTWHSPVPRGPVTLLSMSDYTETRVSNAVDPR
jgi:mannose-6-phosphate isomerase-like protein (cupin superfamily)